MIITTPDDRAPGAAAPPTAAPDDRAPEPWYSIHYRGAAVGGGCSGLV